MNEPQPQIQGILDPLSWHGLPAPPRQWLVAGLIPLHNVTMLAGDGGLGKSLLVQQLVTACALDRDWINRPVKACKAIGLFCEDDRDELWRRQEDICRLYDVEHGDLEHLKFLSRVAMNNLLIEFASQFEAGVPTAFYGLVREFALDFGAQIVVLDSLHDLFGGNENSRPQARQFIGLLRELAIAIDGAVILTAHPSLSGRDKGTGESGSTAWSNAVRSRLYLTRLPDDEMPSPDKRLLTSKKSNYSALAEDVGLTWRDGVFVADEVPTGVFAGIAKDRAERVFIECLAELTERGSNVSDSRNAANYAPKIMTAMPQARGCRRRDLEGAMHRLFHAKAIRNQTYGPASRERQRIVLVEK
jgi:RecA-family ATPase